MGNRDMLSLPFGMKRIRHCNTVNLVLNFVFYSLVIVNRVKPIHFICH